MEQQICEQQVPLKNVEFVVTVGGDGSVRTFGMAQIDTLKPGANSKFEEELVGPVAGGAAYTVTASGCM